MQASQRIYRTVRITNGRDLDPHKGNIVVRIPDLGSKSGENAMMALDLPQRVPVFTRDQLYQSSSLPKYLVHPGSLVECVGKDDICIKIIDLREGSSWWFQSRYRRAPLSSRSILQYRSTSKSSHSVASSGTGDRVQPSLNIAQG